MRALVAACVAVLALASCGPSTAEAEPFEGQWRSIGFGGYITISQGAVEVYEYGDDHCVRVAESGSRGIAEVLTLEGDDELVLREAGRIVRYERSDLPDGCVIPEEFYDDDAPSSLGIVVEAMEDHYAGSLDDGWAARAAVLGDGLTAGSPPSEAFEAITALLDPLDDPQVRLSVQEPQQGVPEGVWRSAAAPVADRLAAAALAGEHLLSVEGTEGDGAMVAGLAADGVGYLAVTTLEPFAGGVARTGEAMARVVDGLIESSGPETRLVLDLRANDGGVEGLGMILASRFVQEETLVASRRARVGGTDDFVDAGSIVVRPAPTGVFPGELAVLVGPGTSGAAELLVLALRQVPGVTFVGEPTAGSPSPILARALPVGWSLGLPNQRTEDASGTSFDGIGVPPDVSAPTTLADLEAGVDPGLEAAVEAVAD